MVGRCICQIAALLGLLASAGCAAWCAHHYPQQQCCTPCCTPCAPAAYAPAPAPTWTNPCTCAPPGR